MNAERPVEHVCYGFRCWGCHEPLLMAFDATDRRAPFQFQSQGKVIVACKHCGERRGYARTELMRFIVRTDEPIMRSIPATLRPSARLQEKQA